MKRLYDDELEEIAHAIRARHKKLHKLWNSGGIGADEALGKIKSLKRAASKMNIELREDENV